MTEVPNVTPDKVSEASKKAVEEIKRTLIHNEQTKIRATFLNTAGGALVAAGIITPLASLAITNTSINEVAVVVMLIWLIGAIILHYGALLVLESLR